MRDHIRFFLNGCSTQVRGDDIFFTLADYLRRGRRLTGTKIVCAEGDCGSCTVLIGRMETGRIVYRAIASCIQILFQLDGAHVITVEGLREGEALNPIQQAMVTCQGTQCGFCTPGFVVALQTLLEEGSCGNGPLDAEKIRRGLTGNLCRCTGYDSIIRAALSTDRSALKSIDALYPPEKIAEQLTQLSGEEVRIQTTTKLFYKPVTIEQACAFRAQFPDCSIIAGGTDLGVVYNKKLRSIDVALNLNAIATLQTVNVSKTHIRLGAGCTLSELRTLTQTHLPELGRFMDWFGSPLIRNAGTIGGNLVTGSPIGDTLPALFALGAQLEITGPEGARTVPIDQFYTGYRKTVLGRGELLTAVQIPLLKEHEQLKLYKISRRKDLDISTFGAAIFYQLVDGVLADIRLIYGGVGPMVMRMRQTEEMLRGKTPTLELFQQAGQVARGEVTPITDVRGSAEYRRTLAENILTKLWYEVFFENEDAFST